jgi:imidazoleglycerol-phosphate dehydratase
MEVTDAQGARANARVGFGAGGDVRIATGLSVLDYLVTEFARAAGAHLSLEVAPGTADEQAAGAGRALGEALAGLLRAEGAAGHGFAWLPADEALAGAVIEVSPRSLLASNVDFSGERVGGIDGDVVARFLQELAAGASLNVHIRVLEGKDPQNVLLAIFKALGAAVGQACRTSDGKESG